MVFLGKAAICQLNSFIEMELEGFILECLQQPELLRQRDVDGRLPLHRLCLQQDVGKCVGLIEQLIRIYPEAVNTADEEGYIPLHMVCQSGSVPLFDSLVRFDSQNICTPAQNGRTPLHFAAQNRHVTICKRILRLKPVAASCLSNDGRLPLHLASVFGCSICIEELVEAFPAGVWTKTTENRDSPLRIATEFNHFGAVKYLFSKYPNAALETDSLGLTPLLVALQSRFTDVSRLLIELSPESIGICQSVTNRSALHMACFFDDLKTMEMITAQRPALVGLQDIDGMTALHICAQNGYTEQFGHLVRIGPQCIGIMSHQSRSVLHFAAQNDHTDIVRLILAESENNGYLCSLASEDGLYLPLHLASFNDCRQTITLLLQACPSSANARNFQNWLPIHSYLFGSKFYDRTLLRLFLVCNRECVKEVENVASCIEIFLGKGANVISFVMASRLGDVPQYPVATVSVLKQRLSESYLWILRDMINIDREYDPELRCNVQWIFRSAAVMLTFFPVILLGDGCDDMKVQASSLLAGVAILRKLHVSAVDIWKYVINYL
jgi:ankyrin repeat protein